MDAEYEVSIRCTNLADKDLLSKSDPVAILLANVPGTKRFIELGRTELVKDCLNPRFAKKIRLTPGLTKGLTDCLLRVAVVDIDDFDDTERLSEQEFIGRADFQFSSLIANPTYSVTLSGNSGHVIFSTVQYDASLDGHVTLELANHSFPLKDKAIFLEIHRSEDSCQNEADDESGFTLVYRSEQSVTGGFEPIKASLFTLALGNRNRALRLELWRYSPRGDHVRLGRGDTSLSEMEQVYVNANVPLLSFDYKGKAGRRCTMEIKFVDVRQ